MKTITARLTALSGLFAGVLTLAIAVIGGCIKPGFSHRIDFLSELNDAGSPHALLVGYFGLVPAGILTLLFVWRLRQEIARGARSSVGLVFISLVGIDLLVTHFAPCDAGCPVSGNISLSQQIHNLSGAVSGVLVPIGIYLLIRPLREARFGAATTVVSIIAIATMAFGFFAMATNALPNYVGVVQRVSISGFYIYLALLSGVVFLRSTPPAAAQ